MCGSIDGTFIPMRVKKIDENRYRNRKNIISTNVLIVWNLDLLIQYAYVGAEGSGHDSGVLRLAQDRGFKIPEGKFLLADCGYPIIPHQMLTPYRNVAYHIADWQNLLRNNHVPTNAQEIFNYRHAQLRNSAERGNGLLKRRFRILRTNTMEYTDYYKTFLIIYATIAIHNYINLNDRMNLENNLDPDIQDEPDNNDNIIHVEIQQSQNLTRQQIINAENWRNEMANTLWVNYNNQI